MNIATFVLSTMVIFAATWGAVAQNVVNNGDGIVISSGAYLVIGGKFINETATQDGFVDNDGNMIVFGDFINNSDNLVFSNIEAIPDGKTILPAATQQSIDGSFPTHFENLKVSGGVKDLDAACAYVAGKFSLASVFRLNSHILELGQSSPGVLDYQSGYLLAETEPAFGLGVLRWNIDDQAGTYNVPFGSGMTSDNDLNVSLKIIQTATGSGPVSFSTYPTVSSNDPLPDLVPSLEPYDPEVTVNRFWFLDAEQPTKPEVQITVRYTDVDVHPISESTLGAIRFNSALLAWDDLTPSGSGDAVSNSFTTDPVLPADFYKNWTLTGSIPEDFIYIPNSFSPNGDGTNEWFGPVIGNDGMLRDYSFTIFDRWGTQLFSSEKQGEGWDGLNEGKECQQDVYVWVFRYRDVQSTLIVKSGKVTIIR
ncbi:hypothetical protein DSECCO2_508070 [anaerobic digester metagenome]